MQQGDVVRRTQKEPENSVAWMHLSINTDYEVEHILENGLLVLKNFLMLVHPNDVVKTVSDEQIKILTDLFTALDEGKISGEEYIVELKKRNKKLKEGN